MTFVAAANTAEAKKTIPDATCMEVHPTLFAKPHVINESVKTTAIATNRATMILSYVGCKCRCMALPISVAERPSSAAAGATEL